MSTDDKVMKDAQYRKGLGIAWFNATNSAIALLTADKINMTPSEMEVYISRWRDWFLDGHKRYYAEVIANVGKNYDASKTIETIKSAKNKKELSLIWQSLSEDERHDGDIRKVVKELKESYEK